MNSSDFVIKTSIEALDGQNEPFCAVCENRVKYPLHGFVLCFADSNAPTCWECGRRHAPELQALIELGRFAEPPEWWGTPPEYWGTCPSCGKNDGYLNVRSDHWFKCDEHKVKWWVGNNLFVSWLHETDEDWQRNTVHLEAYREVEPQKSDMLVEDSLGGLPF